MINAGIKVLSFDGTQTYNTTTTTHNNVSVQVTYPVGQNYTNSPITIGDFVTESSGNIWKVTYSVASDSATKKFKVNLLLVSDTPSADISPSYGVGYGAVCTAVNGVLAPFWDPSLVMSNIPRIVSIYNAKNASSGTGATTDPNTGKISTTVLPVNIAGGIPTLDTNSKINVINLPTNVANGVASLDNDSKIITEVLPDSFKQALDTVHASNVEVVSYITGKIGGGTPILDTTALGAFENTLGKIVTSNDGTINYVNLVLNQ